MKQKKEKKHMKLRGSFALAAIASLAVAAGALALPSRVHAADGIDIEKTFEDATLREYVVFSFDGDRDGSLSPEEIKAATVLNLGSCNVKTLKGIEVLTNLGRVDCSSENLTTADFSHNPELEDIDIASCKNLTSLNVSKNTKLRCLDCTDCNLTRLDLTANVALEELECGSCSLTSLDVTHCPELYALNISNDHEEHQNKFTTIDLSKNTKLQYLAASRTQMTSIDLSKNTKLTMLVLNRNRLTSLDVSACTDLNVLLCEGNNISKLNIGKNVILNGLLENEPVEKTDTEGETSFTYNVYSTPYSYYAIMYVDKKTQIISDKVTEGAVEINETTFPDPMFRDYALNNCDRDGDKKLSPFERDVMRTLYVDDAVAAGLSEVQDLTGIKYFRKLEFLDCSFKLKSLDVSGMQNLTDLYCRGNGMTSLDVRNCPNLTELDCSGNQLTELNLNTCPKLKMLDISENPIKNLLISRNELLKKAFATEPDVQPDSLEYSVTINGIFYQLRVERDVNVIAACEHSWDAGKVTTAPGCLTTGERTYTCTICELTKTETVPAAGHKPVIDKAVAATTKKTGLTEGSHCSVCGAVLMKQQVVPMLPSAEWVKGKWYNKNGTQTYKYTGKWKSDKKGWWYQDTSGWYPKKQWQKIDGKWYYFKADGYMASNEWCKGYWLNKNGSWTYKPKASWKKDKTGWWFGCKGWYAKNQWQKIDGKWYYFDKKGYIVTGTKKIGKKTYSFDENGACLNP